MSCYLPFPRITPCTQYFFFGCISTLKKRGYYFASALRLYCGFFIFTDYILRSCFCARDPGDDNRCSLMEGTTMSALKVHYVTAIPRKINVKTHPTQSYVTWTLHFRRLTAHAPQFPNIFPIVSRLFKFTQQFVQILHSPLVSCNYTVFFGNYKKSTILDRSSDEQSLTEMEKDKFQHKETRFCWNKRSQTHA